MDRIQFKVEYSSQDYMTTIEIDCRKAIER